MKSFSTIILSEMNKNLPVEIWDMIEVERRRAFRRRVDEFEDKFEYSVGWKNAVLEYSAGWDNDALEFTNRGVKSFMLSENSEGVTFDFAFSYKHGITTYRFVMTDEEYGFSRGLWLEPSYGLGAYWM